MAIAPGQAITSKIDRLGVSRLSSTSSYPPPSEVYLRISMAPPPTRWQLIRKGLLGIPLSPICWMLAYRYKAPGLYLRRHTTLLALRLLISGNAIGLGKMMYQLLFWPLDSTRYFEFDFMWRALIGGPYSGRYLDVSSPRLFPVLLLLNKPALSGDLINPDAKDLNVTASLVRAAGLADRVALQQFEVERAPFPGGTFNLITCMSVLEHIPDDRTALAHMWDLLKPGGRLLITVPCAANASVQLADVSFYGAKPDERGWSLFQHIYDQRLLEERIFSVTGPPSRVALFGEKRPGILSRSLARRRADFGFPLWKEPLFIGREFQCYSEINELPGEGVIGFEFMRE